MQTKEIQIELQAQALQHIRLILSKLDKMKV